MTIIKDYIATSKDFNETVTICYNEKNAKYSTIVVVKKCNLSSVRFELLKKNCSVVGIR